MPKMIRRKRGRSGIDGRLRDLIFARVIATDKRDTGGLSAGVICAKFLRKDLPEHGTPFDKELSFRCRDRLLEQLHDFLAASGGRSVAVFPVNDYGLTVPTVSGPFIHPLRKLVSYTPREWPDSWFGDNNSSVGVMFAGPTGSWCVRTWVSEGVGEDFGAILLADREVLEPFLRGWKEWPRWIRSVASGRRSRKRR